MRNIENMVAARLVRNSAILVFACLMRLATPETKKTLPLALFNYLRRPFVAAIIPRLFLLGFRYSQPILIKESIRYVVASPTGTGSSRGSGLVVSAMIIYIGLAVRVKLHSLL